MLPGSNTPYVYNYVPGAVGNSAGTIVWTDSAGNGHVWTPTAGDSQPSALAGISLTWINSSGLAVGGTNPGQGTGAGIVDNTSTNTTVAANLPGPAYYVNDAGQVGGTTNFAGAYVWSQTASNGWSQGTTNLSGMSGRRASAERPLRSGPGYELRQRPCLRQYKRDEPLQHDRPRHKCSRQQQRLGRRQHRDRGDYAYTDSPPSAWLWDGTTLHHRPVGHAPVGLHGR